MSDDSVQVVRVPEVVHPITPPAGATLFRLQKGGMQGAPCLMTNDLGVTVEHHPLEKFDKDFITGRWGFDGCYVVQFFREPEPGKRQVCGAKKKFGLIGEEGEYETHAELVPGYPPPRPSSGAGAMTEMMGMLTALKGVADADSRAAIQANQIHADAALAATRDAHRFNLELMTQVMARSQAPAVDPSLSKALEAIAEGQKMIVQMLADETEEEEEPDEDELKKQELKALTKAVHRDGMKAFYSFVKDKGAEALVDMLPEIKEQLPGFFMLLMQFLSAKLGELTTPKTVEATPAVVPPAPIVESLPPEDITPVE